MRSARAVKVPLPEGWTAHAGPDQSVTIGPEGRPVLRIDPKPGRGDARPDSSALASLFAKDLKEDPRVIIAPKEQRDEATFSSGQLALTAPGGGQPRTVLLGAKRVDSDLFLCATLPGASDAEATAAMRACGNLSYEARP